MLGSRFPIERRGLGWVLAPGSRFPIIERMRTGLGPGSGFLFSYCSKRTGLGPGSGF